MSRKSVMPTEQEALPGRAHAEDYHQQYLAKNPSSYCGLGRCGVPFEPAWGGGDEPR